MKKRRLPGWAGKEGMRMFIDKPYTHADVPRVVLHVSAFLSGNVMGRSLKVKLARSLSSYASLYICLPTF